MKGRFGTGLLFENQGRIHCGLDERARYLYERRMFHKSYLANSLIQCLGKEKMKISAAILILCITTVLFFCAYIVSAQVEKKWG
jgi:hypothetical protein